MLKINKLAFVALTLLIIHSYKELSAQQRTYSPFSRFGLGETQILGYSGASGMGFTGIGMRSSFGINNLNVASLTALDTLSFYFDGGMSYYWQKQEAQNGNIQNSDMVFDYIALAFSVNKRVTSSVGFKPVSGTGYNFLTTKVLEDGTEANSELDGSGNLTQAYYSIAVKPFEQLSVGGTVSYLFGNLRNISKASFAESTGALNHGIYKEIRVSSLLYDFGAQFTHELDENKSIVVGVTYRPKLGLKGDSTTLIARGSQFGDDNNLFSTYSDVDTLRYGNSDYKNNELEYSSSFGIGISYNIKDRLSVGFDYLNEPWSDAAHFDKSFAYKNASRYSLGAEFIPNDRSAKSYLNRVRYRMGAYYRDENISIDGDDFYNYGITFGLGLPLKRSKTSVNLSFELGTKDTNGNNNYKQSYGKLTANFSLHELWFYKRKFD